jgi:hypothetical protein
MKCQNNKIDKGDLVYWYDPWNDNAGIGVVICFQLHWIKILSDCKSTKFILSANVNVEKIEKYSSLDDFTNQKSSLRYIDE